MDPKTNWSEIHNGKRYSVASSTLLAGDDYWDGRNWERRGRNTFLYQTSGGAFFVAHLTMWQGEEDHLEPVTRESAMALYETLREKREAFEDAFDIMVEEAADDHNTKTEKEVKIWLPNEMIEWLESQPRSARQIIVDLLAQAIAA